MKQLRKILKQEKGQGMLEYVLLLAIIAGLVMAFKGQITTLFNGATQSLNDKASKAFQDP